MIKKTEIKSESSGTGRTLLIKALKYAGAIISIIILICILIIVVFPDSFINSFAKSRIEKAFAEQYPAYALKIGDMHYSFWKNRLGCDSLLLKAKDSSYTFNTASVNISGISWIKVLVQGDITPYILSSMIIDAGSISLNFHKLHEVFLFEKLHISVPDSEVVTDSVRYHSLLSDEQFFSKSKFRQTKLSFDIHRINIVGLDFQGLFFKNEYKTRSIKIHDVLCDILVNMDKPYDAKSDPPLMPNEALLTMKETFKIDSLKIVNGRLNYAERYAVKAVPGVVMFNKINVLARGIANHSTIPDTAVIQGEGVFMNSGKMKLSMIYPLTSKKFSLKYSGSVGPMDVTKLNSFIVTAEHHRIKSGNIQSARFNINVNSGYASGTLKAEYRNLTIAILNKKTGSERGIFDRIASFFGKIFIIRGSNIPDDNGNMKIGEIKYARKPNDYFTQFLWFALRGSIADVAGFPRE